MTATAGLQLWGGIECTHNRVRGSYFDQLERSGHTQRPDDLDRIADLGIDTLRYPILWERTAPVSPDLADWSWADERLGRMRALRLRPIVGLVHHGSGPPGTSLIARDFAPRLAEYAGAVARRYPWVEYYTPVNEPLTTARFSGLYGFWYPHGKSDAIFVRALLNQCRAVVLAMRAIRQFNPAAKLVQTDDLGKVHSTRKLAYQAKFENERRWLAWDLLAGRVSRRHALWGYLRKHGANAAELAWFQRFACPPDVIGLNYYLTSERYLDEQVTHYPPEARGGNRRHRYADVAAAHGPVASACDLGALLREAHERYGSPLAITESHLGCTREEQMRWLWEVWQSAVAARADGVDVNAVTVWSLLGSYDWASLVTRWSGEYEPGVFDVRSGRPRETALGRIVRALAAGREADEAVLQTAGWWRRPERPRFGPVVAHRPDIPPVVAGQAPPLLIAGATGTLGAACARIAAERGLNPQSLHRGQLDVTSRSSVQAALDTLKPWAVVNATGYVRVDDAEFNEQDCRRVNTEAVSILAEACSQRGIRLVTFSSDLIFDGNKKAPYLESDVPAPLNVYGLSKLEAEREALQRHPEALVIRTSAFFGPWDEANFAVRTLRCVAAGQPIHAADDVVISPTYVPDLVHAALDLLIDHETGVWHVANSGPTTWSDFGRALATRWGLSDERVVGVPVATLGWGAPRPRYSALTSEKGRLMPPWEDAVERYFTAVAGASLIGVTAAGIPG